jgi:serine/threonine-protein kinase RsbW
MPMRVDASWHRRPVPFAPPPCTTYPATAEAVGVARRHILRIAREAGAGPRVLADIELAASEALTNAILHACGPAGGHGEVFAVATASEGARFSIWVIDEGRGGTPSAPSSGLGLGLELMARFTERLRIGVLDDGRTQVELRFDLHAAAPDTLRTAGAPQSS